MFRKIPKHHLKEIEEWPTTLDGYGCFLNEESDQVRLIVRPADKMVYKLTSSMEYNDRRLAAFRRAHLFLTPLTIGVLSGIAVERVEKLGMRKLRVPLGIAEDEPHTVVLVSKDFETNTKKLAVLMPFADELGMWASRVIDEETVHSGSLEDATKALTEKGYAVIALNPKQNWWDPVRKCQLSQTEMRFSRRKFQPVLHNGSSASHIQYVMDHVVPLCPAEEIYTFAHWGSCREVLEYLNTTYDDKWAGKLKALGMAQGTYAMENITSAKFRVFLAERAINYLYIANVSANVLLTNTNIGCPNISFGPNCDLYEFMASRTLEKTVKFFEGGQAAILEETVVEEEPEPEDSLDALWNWEELREKIDCGDTERFVEVGIGTGGDDSEWFRVK